ncbi:SH3 domain protein [Verrucomicrobiia bacterium DG1235]|nr:SH3 domain protein [Verrucomicrobiae bacterium DG1235]
MTPLAEKGERVSFIAFDPKNAAWFRGRDARGVVGYFPVGWFRIDEAGGLAEALRDYDAAELTVAVGEEIELIESFGEWCRVETGQGLGWIPVACCRS